MGWTWKYLRLDETEIDAPPASAFLTAFPTQADAESWLGETYATLLNDGVDHVVLFEGERKVYGPMSLHPTT